MSRSVCTVLFHRIVQCTPTLTSIQDLFQPNSWQTPVALYYSMAKMWHFGHGIVQCSPNLTSIQDLFQPNSWQTPVALSYSMAKIWHFGHGIVQCSPTLTAIQDLFQPNSWQTPVALYYSMAKIWHFGHGIVQCSPTLTSIQDLFQPNSWQTTLAAVTVYSAPDDGLKGRPKHVEHIIYNKPTRCNSGSIVFIKNYKYALHVSDALCAHLQEHYKL